jgi:hypothetical protein
MSGDALVEGVGGLRVGWEVQLSTVGYEGPRSVRVRALAVLSRFRDEPVSCCGLEAGLESAARAQLLQQSGCEPAGRAMGDAQARGSDWHTRRLDPERRTRDLVRQLQTLGHQVTLTPTA